MFFDNLTFIKYFRSIVSADLGAKYDIIRYNLLFVKLSINNLIDKVKFLQNFIKYAVKRKLRKTFDTQIFHEMRKLCLTEYIV